MADNNTGSPSPETSKHGFLRKQFMDIQFTNPFTGAVHNLMNAPETIKNLFGKWIHKPATSATFKNADPIPIEDIIDGLATALNTTFYGWEQLSLKYKRETRKSLSWVRQNSNKTSSSAVTKNDMDKVEFAKMCKKCPVKLHNSTDATNYKETYWTILEPEKDQGEAFKKIFGVNEKIILLYWNDTVKGNASKFTDGMETLLANLTNDGKQIVKVASEPEDTNDSEKKGDKLDQKEREDFKRVERMAKRKKYGLTANTGQFSWEPTIVDDLLQARKQGVKWVKVFKDKGTEVFTLSESKDDEEKKTNDEKSPNEKLLGRLFAQLKAQQNNPYMVKKINAQIKIVFGKIMDERSKDKRDEIESCREEKENYRKEKENCHQEMLKYQQKKKEFGRMRDEAEKEAEDKKRQSFRKREIFYGRKELEFQKKEKEFEKKETEAENKIRGLNAQIQALDDEKATMQEWIVLSKKEIEDKIEDCDNKISKLQGRLIDGEIDSDEVNALTEVIEMQKKMLMQILDNYDLAGLSKKEQKEKDDEEAERQNKRSKENTSMSELTSKIDGMDVTGGVLYAICDIRNMEKTIDGEDAIDNKKLNDKLKSIKTSDDFQLGLAYDANYTKTRATAP